MKKSQKWIAPKKPPVPARHLPDPKKPFYKGYPSVEANIRAWASEAKVSDQADTILAFTRDAMAEYVQSCVRDKAVAWPDDIKPLRDRLQEATDLMDLDAAESTLLRMTTVAPFAYEGARDVLEAVIRDLDELAGSKGALVGGGWPAMNRARHEALARKFWGAFLAHDWPTKTNPKALMHRLLKQVLEAAGEEYATVKKLLEDTKPNT